MAPPHRLSCSVFRVVFDRALGAGTARARRRETAQARDRFLADLQRRLLRPSVQHAGQDQRVERRRSDPGLGLPAQREARAPAAIKGTPLQINGVIYLTAPDHVWALDARTGREMWHHTWQSTGGIHIGNRGAAVLGEWLYFETPDCHLVSLNIKDGSERWRKQICDLDQFYYGSVAPVIVEEPRHRRRQRRRPRRPRLRPGARSRDRRDAVAVVRRAAEEGRSRVGDLAERRSREAWRRDDMAAGDLRSGSESDLRHDRQSAAGHRAQQSRRRQPLHRVDRGAQPGHREDGVVLPVVAARYARLGLDADAGPLRRRDQRPAAQAPRAGGAGTATSSCSIERPERRSCHPNT